MIRNAFFMQLILVLLNLSILFHGIILTGSLRNLLEHDVQRTGPCAGGEIAFRLLRTAVKFIDLSSLFILLLNVDRHAGTTADA